MSALSTQVRTEIAQMVERFDAAIAAGKSIDSRVQPMVAAAKAALSCNDPQWLARASHEDARGVVTLAANGDLSGNYKLI